MSTIIITVDTKEPDRLFASTVRAMRRSLDVSAAELAKAAGIPLPRLEAIEAGGTTTRDERHTITDALSWLSNHRVARALTRSQRPLSTMLPVGRDPSHWVQRRVLLVDARLSAVSYAWRASLARTRSWA